MKHFTGKDNGCQCLDCRRMYEGERWLALVKSKGLEEAEKYAEETRRLSDPSRSGYRQSRSS